MPSKTRTTRLFHQDVIIQPMEQIADHCIDLVETCRSTGRRPALVFAMNPEKSMQSHRDPVIRQLLQQSDVLIPDGIGTCIGARVLNGVRIKRVPGSELMPELCTPCRARRPVHLPVRCLARIQRGRPQDHPRHLAPPAHCRRQPRLHAARHP